MAKTKEKPSLEEAEVTENTMLPVEVQHAVIGIDHPLIQKIASIQTFDNSVLEEYRKMTPELTAVKLGDVQGMKNLSKAINALTKLRTSSEKEHKLVKENFLKVTNAMDLMKRTVAGMVDKVQEPLIKHRDALEKEQADLDAENTRRMEAKVKARQNQLNELSFGFNGTEWIQRKADNQVEFVALPQLQVIEMSDEMFNDFLNMHRPEHERIVAYREEQARLAAEAKAAAERAAAEAEAKANEAAAEQARLAEQALAMKAQLIASRIERVKAIPHVQKNFHGRGWTVGMIMITKELIETATEEAFALQVNLLMAQSSELQAKAAAAAAIASRERDLALLGLVKHTDAFTYKGSPVVKVANIMTYSDEDWLNKVLPGVRVFAEKRDADLAAAAEQASMASATDQQNATAIIEALKKITFFEATTDDYRDKVSMAKDYVERAIRALK